MLPTKFAFVDIETTGGRSKYDKVIEIGITTLDDGKITNTWSSLTNPNRSLDPFIANMTGITQAELSTAPQFETTVPTIKKLLKDRIFVAHNVHFDYNFLFHEFARLGEDFKHTKLCTVRLSRQLYPEHRRHNLNELIQRHNINVEDRHRALADAVAIAEFFQIAQEKFEDEHFNGALKSLLKKPSLPAHIKPETVESLPNCPGVYLLYDQQGDLLYIGKSREIKTRVMSHFYSDRDNVKEEKLKKLVAHIEHQTTAGELEALLLESRLVKDLKPLLNRQLKSKKSHTIITKEFQDNYLVAKIEQTEDIRAHSNIIAILKSKSSAQNLLLQKTKEHQLCQKLLNIEQAHSSCFGYQLDTCKGACLQKEPAIAYNLRFEEAFEHTKLTNWPYQTSIAIVESNHQTKQNRTLVFDNWRLVGELDQAQKFQAHPDSYFDLDTYKILKRFIRKKPNLVKPITIDLGI